MSGNSKQRRKARRRSPWGRIRKEPFQGARLNIQVVFSPSPAAHFYDATIDGERMPEIRVEPATWAEATRRALAGGK